MSRVKSYARSLDELRNDFTFDIQRRLDVLDNTLKTMRPSAAEAARIARARTELLHLLDYWKEVEVGFGEKREA